MEGEVLSVRNSRKIYFPVYFMILVLFLAVGMIKYQGKEVNDFAFKSVLVFSALGIVWTEMHRLRNKYEITDNSVVHIKGLFFRTIKKTDIHALSDAELKQNPWQRILGIGNVSANAFSEVNVLRNVNSPHDVIGFLEGKMTKKSLLSASPRKGSGK
ncbi:PH domain-containing protein [Candidatus Pacearchaeota archaeon]|nr:PH domain-containing protein [Candidatus Pacearchaeota archaeon]